MGKKDFFSSFEKNLSIDKVEKAPVEKTADKSDITDITKNTTTTKKDKKAATTGITKNTKTTNITKNTTTTGITKNTKQSHITDNTEKDKKADTTNITKNTSTTDITKVTTFRIKVEVLEKIKALAYWDREKIQDVLDKALNEYLDKVPAKEMEKALKAYKG